MVASRSEPSEGTEGPQSGQRTCSKGKDGYRLSKLTNCKEESMSFLGKRPNQEESPSRF